MVAAANGVFKQAARLIEFEAMKEDSYQQLAMRAAQSLGMVVPDGHELVLLRPKVGAIILDEAISLKGVEKPWTLGNYRLKKQKRADILKFGVAVIATSKPQEVWSLKRDSVQLRLNIPLQCATSFFSCNLITFS